jgi:hypothetical protein
MIVNTFVLASHHAFLKKQCTENVWFGPSPTKAANTSKPLRKLKKKQFRVLVVERITVGSVKRKDS